MGGGPGAPVRPPRSDPEPLGGGPGGRVLAGERRACDARTLRLARALGAVEGGRSARSRLARCPARRTRAATGGHLCHPPAPRGACRGGARGHRPVMLPTGPLPTPVPVTRTDLTQPAVPLKARPRSADTVPMGIKGITPPPGPTPKALCPSCHRPVALLKAGKCVYCGAIIPGL